MKIFMVAMFLVVASTPLWAGETGPRDGKDFEFDQPFDDAMATGLLRSLFAQALDAFEDHIEWKGRLRHDPKAGKDEGRFQLRLYPQGKSRSGDHVAAEGSFHLSPDLTDNEVTLRFKSSQEPQRRSLGADPDVL